VFKDNRLESLGYFYLVVGDLFGGSGDSVFASEPFAEVHEFAAFGAEWEVVGVALDRRFADDARGLAGCLVRDFFVHRSGFGILITLVVGTADPTVG
jgi:hypothetical protein